MGQRRTLQGERTNEGHYRKKAKKAMDAHYRTTDVHSLQGKKDAYIMTKDVHLRTKDGHLRIKNRQKRTENGYIYFDICSFS